MNIQKKIVIFPIALSLAMLVFALLVTIINSKNLLQKQISNHLWTTIQSRTHHIETLLDNYKKITKTISAGNSFRDAVDEKLDISWRTQQVNRRITSIINSYHGIESIRILNRKGVVTFSSNENIGIDKSDHVIFLKGKEKVHIGEIHKSAFTGSFVISISTPIFVRDKFSGVLVINFGVEQGLFKLLTDRTGLGETGETYLVNKKGYIVSPSLFVDDLIFKTKINNEQVNSYFSEQTEEEIYEENQKGAKIYYDYRGVKVMGLHHHIPEMGCVLIAEFNYKEIVKPIIKIINLVFLLFFIVLIITIFISFQISKNITRPITELHHGVKEITAGNLSYKVGTKRKDEIGHFSRAFDLMTSKITESNQELQKINEELEEKVKDRTYELENQFNKSEAQRIATLSVLSDLKESTKELQSEIDERKKMVMRLKESEERFKKLSNLTFEGIVIHENGVVIDVNESLLNLIGYSRKEIIGKNIITQAIHPDFHATVKEHVQMKIARPYEVMGIKKDGTVFPVEIEAKNIIDHGKEYRVAAIRDITNRRKVQEKLEKSLSELQQSQDATLNIMNDLNQEIEEHKKADKIILEQKKDYLDIFDGVPNKIWYFDSNGKILRANKAVANLIDNDITNIVGKTIFDIFPYHQANEYHKIMEKVIKTGKASIGIIDESVIDGEIHWHQTDRIPKMDKNGKTEGIIVISQDITRQKQAEEFLKHEQDLLQSLMDNIPDTIYFKNTKSQFVRINKAQAQLLGLEDPKNAIGKTDFDFFREKHARQTLNEEQVIIESGKPLLGKTEKIRDANGQFHWVSTTKVGIKNENGQISGIVGISRDITDLIKAEEKLIKLSYAIKQSPSAIAMTDLNGEMEYVNPKFCELTGYSFEEVIGKNPRILKSGTLPDEEYENLWQTLLNGNDWYGEFHNKKKNGTFYWEKALISPIKNSKGTIINYLKVAEDITKHKEFQTALRNSEEKHRLLVENAPIGICTSNLNGMFLSVNKAYCDITGYSEEELLKLHFNDITVEKFRQKNEKIIKELIENKSNHAKLVKQDVRKDGKIIDVELNMYIQRDENGKAAYLIALLADITKQKEMEAHLRQAQKMESLGTLAGGISHDFNNLLQIILGYSTLLKNKLAKDSEEQKNNDYIIDAAKKASDLVAQILIFSRQTPKEKKPIILQNLVRNSLKMLRGAIPSNINIKTEIDQHVGQIFGDQTQVNQIIMNLCTNAYHSMATMDGELTVKLEEVKIDDDTTGFPQEIKNGRYARLIVKDTGHGIPKEVMNRIFDPFFTTKEVGQGTGMGLSMIMGIIKDYNGYIDVKSQQNIGTEFLIYLPIIENQKERISAVELDSKVKIQGNESILIIDDNDYVANSTKYSLIELGYKAESVFDSRKALEIFKEKPYKYDLLIIDFLMPNLSGLEFYKEAAKIRPNIKCFLCTGFIDEETHKEILEAGILRILHKPTLAKDIAKQIRMTFDQSID